MATMPPTTAFVAATPTPSAVFFVRMPDAHPMNPTRSPNNALLASPNAIMKSEEAGFTYVLQQDLTAGAWDKRIDIADGNFNLKIVSSEGKVLLDKKVKDAKAGRKLIYITTKLGE